MGQTLDPEVIESTASRLGIDLTRSASDLSASELLDFQVLRAIVYRANLVIISDLPADVDQGDFLDEFFEAHSPALQRRVRRFLYRSGPSCRARRPRSRHRE